MKTDRVRKPRRVFIVIVLFAVGFAAAYVYLRGGNAAEAQRDASTLSAKERGQLSELSKLLSPQNISINESKTIDANNSSFRLAMIRIESPAKESLLIAPSSAADLTVTDLGTSTARRPTMRSLELSTHSILAAITDANNDLVSWGIYPDPRIFRTETSDLDGKLEGFVLYRSASELLLSVPAQNSALVIHLFHPKWDGNGYELEPIGSVSIQ